MENQKGLIAKIEPFAVRNGPGLRTVVSMKSCPLNCLWCPTPQMQRKEPEIFYHSDQCRNCGGDCIPACPRKAIQQEAQEDIRIDRKSCDGCGLCLESCKQEAIEITGKYYSLADLVDEVEKDISVYNRSGGGVTVSGGEPALQAEFVAAFLRQCRKRNIHTALETSGFAPWVDLALMLESLDLLYFNLKHMDPERHKKLTGVSNQKILKNIQKAANQIPVILRVPVIPGMNDQTENLTEVIRFAKDLGPRLLRLELIPFQRQGEELYRKLGRGYSLSSVIPPKDKIMEKWKKTIVSQGLKARIGG